MINVALESTCTVSTLSLSCSPFTHKHTRTHCCTSVLEFPSGKGPFLKLRDEALEVCFGSLGHLVAVPAGAVRVGLLHLRVQLPTVGEVVHRLESQSGLVPREVQREVHMDKETEVFPHEEKSELGESFCIVLHHPHSKVTEKGSNVLSPLVVALNDILHLVGEELAHLRYIVNEAASTRECWDV